MRCLDNKAYDPTDKDAGSQQVGGKSTFADMQRRLFEFFAAGGRAEA